MTESDRTAYLQTLFGLEGRVAVVTGASGLIGSAIASGLSRAGARVAVLGRGVDAGRQTVDRLEALGGEAIAVSADIRSREQLIQARDQIQERWGGVDILVNIAGGPRVPHSRLNPGQSLSELSSEGTREVIDLNLMGTLLPVLVFAEAMAGSSAASIVNVSSVAAHRVTPGIPGYTAAKSAVESLTRWLAVELTREHGGRIRVNALAPGFVAGDRNRKAYVNRDGTPTEQGREVSLLTPVGRWSTPADLVSTVLWLCGPGASYVNGVVVRVDGGYALAAEP